MCFLRIGLEALLSTAKENEQMIEENTFDSLLWHVAGVEEPDESDLVQATAVAVNEADKDGIYSAKKQLKGWTIPNAALELPIQLKKAYKKRIKDCPCALCLENTKEKDRTTIVDHFGPR